MFFPVWNKKFPVPIAGNSSNEVSGFKGFVQAGQVLSLEITCIFPPIREFQLVETRTCAGRKIGAPTRQGDWSSEGPKI
jgi:hypothetical protein